MIHERFDLKHWTSVFPLANWREAVRDTLHRLHSDRWWPARDSIPAETVQGFRPAGTTITSPIDLAYIEQIRAEVASGSDLGEGVPCDVFVFGRGEPSCRAVTKIGGLPYWPAEKAWPQNRSAEPLTFVAQACFADSRDIVGELPGDILLVFTDLRNGMDGSDVYGAAYESDLFLTWMELDDSRELVDASHVPATGARIQPCYGVIHRTFDWPQGQEHFSEYQFSKRLTILQGTKIGGETYWIQGDEGIPGHVLCTIGSVFPSWTRPFPFVNVPERSGNDQEQKGYLEMGDVGMLYLLIDKRKRVRWCIQSH